MSKFHQSLYDCMLVMGMWKKSHEMFDQMSGRNLSPFQWVCVKMRWHCTFIWWKRTWSLMSTLFRGCWKLVEEFGWFKLVKRFIGMWSDWGLAMTRLCWILLLICMPNVATLSRLGTCLIELAITTWSLVILWLLGTSSAILKPKHVRSFGGWCPKAVNLTLLPCHPFWVAFLPT